MRALGLKSKGTHNIVQTNNSNYSSGKSMAVTATTKPAGNGGSGGNWNGGNKDNYRFGGIRASTNLSPKERDEKRAKKECFWCIEKFTPNHQCAKRKSYVIQLLEMAELLRNEEENDESEEEAEEEKSEL